MSLLLCAACIAFGDLPKLEEAVTVYNGNALCYEHLEVGFSFQPLDRHRKAA